MRAAMIDVHTREIVNIIEISDEDPNAYSPPKGFIVEKDPGGNSQIGGSFLNGVWSGPKTPDNSNNQLEPSTQEQLDTLTQLLKAKSVLTDVDISDIKEPKLQETIPEDPRKSKLGRRPQE